MHIRIGSETLRLTWDEWEQRVRAGRIPPDALVRFEPVTGEGWEPAAELEMYTALRDEDVLAWRGRFTGGPPPVGTAALVGFQLRIWLFAQVPWIRNGLVGTFTNWLPPALDDGQSWRLVTMGLLHTDPLHVGLNMLWLTYTGWNLERALGLVNLLVLYFTSVVGGSLLSMWGAPETQSLGASGGIFGLIAASVVFGFSRPELLPERGRRLFGAAMLPYLVLMFGSGWFNVGTDNWSHLGGLLSGGALSLFLDPPTLQRRPGWNARVQAVAAAGLLLVVVGLATLGPRIHPLEDPRRDPSSITAGAGPEDGRLPEALEYRVPAGWRPKINSAGDLAWVYPNGLRSWRVAERQGSRPTTPEAELEEWLERLRRGWPDAEVGPAEAISLGGRPGVEVVVRIGQDREARALVWRGTTRGAFSLAEVWEVEDRASRRMEPLISRLRASVRWGEPPELVEARRLAEAQPRSRQAGLALAQALQRVGAAEEAAAVYARLLDAEPEAHDVWKGLLELHAWYPDLDGSDSVWSRALAGVPGSAAIVSVSEGLAGEGRVDEARGLLDLAWAASPGDRLLRKARRNQGLGTALDEATNLPYELTHEPATGERRAAEVVDARLRREVTLEEAGPRGALLAQEQARVVAAAASLDPAGALPALWYLRHAAPPSSGAAELAGLLKDLEEARGGKEVGWLPAPVVAALAGPGGEPFLTALRERARSAAAPAGP